MRIFNKADQSWSLRIKLIESKSNKMKEINKHIEITLRN